MNTLAKSSLLAVIGLLPFSLQAQTTADQVQSLHTVLENVYDQMIPLCSQLIDVARGIGGFAALFYIGVRVWRHIANAEPVDFFPLFRPFVLALLIGMFPSVLAVMNGILKPTVTATASMVSTSNEAVQTLLARRQAAIQQTQQWKALIGPTGEGDRAEWYKYTHPGQDPDDEGFFKSIGNDLSFELDKIEYNIRYNIKLWISQILEVIYYAASLCIDTIRTFHLIVLAILGSLVFAFSIFDGLQHTLPSWIARYINIYLWLPVANLFGAILGKIQENMIQIDINQVQSAGDTFFTSTDAAYLIFMIIGIIGYFTVPSVANYIVHAHGNNVLLKKTTDAFNTATNTVINAATTTIAGDTNIVSAASGGGASGSDGYKRGRIQG